MKLRSKTSAAAAPARAQGAEALPILTSAYWEDVFAEADPWKYGASDYEKWKFGLTLSLLPKSRIRNALELACAEGHLTELLAPHVGKLLAVDISPTAVRRARARCAKLKNVAFEVLNLVNGVLPQNLDLIMCSEVLFYLPLSVLQEVAPRIVSSLKAGGHVLLAHGNVIADDMTRTGFDWGHDFGAKTIGKVFQAIDDLELVKELRTPLFTIQLLRRKGPGKARKVEPEIEQMPLPSDLMLSPEVEKCILWDGAVMTRAEAQTTESATQVPILMYHSIADDGPAELAPYRVAPAAFRQQLRYLRRHGYHSITLQEWVDGIAAKRPVPGRPVIITFDDGYRDFIQNAWPLLSRADFSATVFVVTEKVGRLADWDGLAKPLELMSWEELRTVSDAGIAIGSHTASHKDLASLSPDRVRVEGERARAMLHEHLGTEVSMIAFPWGKSEPATRAVLAQCGYRIAVRSWGGASPLGDDPLNLSRIEIEAVDNIEAFAKKLTAKAETAATTAPQAEQDRAGSPVGKLAVDDRGNSMPIHPDYARSLSARLDVLVGEFVKLQNQLLNNAQGPSTLQKKLAGLFALPVTGNVSRTVTPAQEIVSEVQVSFEEGALVTVSVEPKADHSLSPDTYLNTLSLSYSGQSKWLSLEVTLDWRDLSLAERFQVSVYAQPNRGILCEAGLRLPRKSGSPLEIIFASFKLSGDERNAVASGELAIPDFIELDTKQKPQLLLFFDTEEDFSLVIHYLNVYFA
jgi:peptidoglycan/xylan/chitin deacetylase (PgdA/CDA1 family)/SAM-dependent methyltransferase